MFIDYYFGCPIDSSGLSFQVFPLIYFGEIDYSYQAKPFLYLLPEISVILNWWSGHFGRFSIAFLLEDWRFNILLFWQAGCLSCSLR